MIAICSRFCSSEGVKDSREVDNEKKNVLLTMYLLCLIAEGVRLQILRKKTPQVHLIIIRE